MADEPELPSEDELRDALDRVGVADILVNALSAAASALPYSGITCMVAVPGTVCIMIGAVPGTAACAGAGFGAGTGCGTAWA